ncbi:MAG: hypothetical protein A2041_10275 [Bacteroidetes bacterium GWA2_31_9b]|nr:MAG: hypothetical protein A2041_10275 [Bacteroidetes bacterium GWA2_31_9b]
MNLFFIKNLKIKDMKTNTIFKIVVLLVLSILTTTLQAQPRNKHHNGRHEPNYRYRDMPHWGYKYKSIPKATFIVPHAGIKYHYHSGVYYRPYGNTYVVVRAPLGVRVRTLPVGNVHFIINGRNYFYYYGTYYVKSVDDSEYITVEPPVGAVVDALPDGYKKIVIENNTYYEFEGTYYKAFLDESGEVLYEVVSVN